MSESCTDGIGEWFAIVFPSLFVVRKYLGWESTIAYAIGVAAILAVVAAFVLIYPVVNT